VQPDAFLVAKLCMFETVVATDAEQDAILLVEIVLVIRKVGRFLGTAGRSVLRVEEEHDMPLPLKIGQIDSLHIGIRQRKRRGFLTNLEQHVVLLKRSAWGTAENDSSGGNCR